MLSFVRDPETRELVETWWFCLERRARYATNSFVTVYVPYLKQAMARIQDLENEVKKLRDQLEAVERQRQHEYWGHCDL